MIHKTSTSLALALLAASAWSTSLFGVDASQSKRPFRAGLFRMNPELDQEKAVAAADNGGFLIRGDVMIGGYNAEQVRAYNMVTRKNLWWQSIQGEVMAPPLLVENTIFISTRSGHLSALNVSSGERLWEVQLDSFSERPLTYSNGFIYIVTAGQVAYSIEAASGKRTWVHDAGFPDMVTVRRAPAPLIHDGRVLIGLATGELLALRADDGKRIWRYNPFYQEAKFKDVIGDLSVHNGKLLVSRYDGFIGLVDISQERQVIWQDRQPSAASSTFRAGRFYVGLTNGEVISYEAASGRVNWRKHSGTTPAFLIASETNLYVFGADGRVTCWDTGTGDYQWGDDLGGRINTPPIIVGNKMFVATGLRNVYGYQIQ
jgi:outer membrane protein assembly factor BamB